MNIKEKFLGKPSLSVFNRQILNIKFHSIPWYTYLLLPCIALYFSIRHPKRVCEMLYRQWHS